MKKKTTNSEMVELPAIVIDDEHKIFFPDLKLSSRMGILTFKHPPAIKKIIEILDATGISFGPTAFISNNYSMVYFLGDLRTLRRNVNGQALVPKRFQF